MCRVSFKEGEGVGGGNEGEASPLKKANCYGSRCNASLWLPSQNCSASSFPPTTEQFINNYIHVCHCVIINDMCLSLHAHNIFSLRVWLLWQLHVHVHTAGWWYALYLVHSSRSTHNNLWWMTVAKIYARVRIQCNACRLKSIWLDLSPQLIFLSLI